MTEKNNIHSRRVVLQTGLGVLAGGAAIAASTAARADEKLAHELVQYQEQPKDGAQCSKCAQFQAPNACAIVASPIALTGWCVAYAPKEG